MIVFHRDKLAPPELCQLLYQIVPLEFHRPVVFNNRKDQSETTRSHAYWRGHPEPGAAFVGINLNPLYGHAMNGACHGSSGFRAWKSLLWTCLHEFGHVATQKDMDYVSPAAYNARFSREHKRVEYVADQWMNRIVWKLAERDKRFAQPEAIGGYMGARLARDFAGNREAGWGTWRLQTVRNGRCFRTGMQLSSGDVLRVLSGLAPTPRNFRLLRELSGGIGKEHIDAAGRRHMLYLYSELPLLARRFALAKQQDPNSVNEFARGTWGHSCSKDMREIDESPF